MAQQAQPALSNDGGYRRRAASSSIDLFVGDEMMPSYAKDGAEAASMKSIEATA